MHRALSSAAFVAAVSLAACGSRALVAGADPDGTVDDPFGCKGTRTLVVVAHPDDDLLFMSPDLLRAVSGGRCVRTVYLTSGDAGADDAYWSAREAGVRAAYAAMAGVPDRWTLRFRGFAGVSLGVHALEGAPRVSLVFLRLPDGRSNGHGYPRRAFDSLDKLWRRFIPSMLTLDHGHLLSRADLIGVLAEVMVTFRPGSISLLDPTPGPTPGHGNDHSDHAASARFAIEALGRWRSADVVRVYRGYNISAEPANLLPEEQRRKWETFLTYAAHDSRLCRGGEPACLERGPYYLWSQRQYPIELVLGGGAAAE